MSYQVGDQRALIDYLNNNPSILSSLLAQAGTPVFNVKGYGAIGNGINDDTAAVQAACNAAATAGGGTVFSPPGTYVINSTSGGFGFSVPSNVQFVGADRDATIYQIGPAMPQPTKMMSVGGTNSANRTQRIRVADLTIDMNRANALGGGAGHGGIFYGFQSYLSLERIRIINSGNRPIQVNLPKFQQTNTANSGQPVVTFTSAPAGFAVGNTMVLEDTVGAGPLTEYKVIQTISPDGKIYTMTTNLTNTHTAGYTVSLQDKVTDHFYMVECEISNQVPVDTTIESVIVANCTNFGAFRCTWDTVGFGVFHYQQVDHSSFVDCLFNQVGQIAGTGHGVAVGVSTTDVGLLRTRFVACTTGIITGRGSEHGLFGLTRTKQMTITDCYIGGDTSTGVALDSLEQLTMKGCVIETCRNEGLHIDNGNAGSVAAPPGVLNLNITDCVIRNNQTSGSGAGISVKATNTGYDMNLNLTNVICVDDNLQTQKTAIEFTGKAGATSTAGTTTYTATTAADSGAAYTTNQWAGFTVTQGANSAVVSSNNATTLTLVAAWSPSTPTNGNAYTLVAQTSFQGFRAQGCRFNTYSNGKAIALNNGSANATLDSPSLIVNCFPPNPIGNQTPAVPASGSPVTAAAFTGGATQTTAPYARNFWVTTGAGTTTMAIGGGPTITLQASVAGQLVRVPAGVTVTPTYTNAPTWVVEAE